MVPRFVECVLDDFDDDEAFNPKHVGEVFACHRGPLRGVVEDGEQIIGRDRVGGVRVLDEAVVDALIDACGDSWVLGFDDA